MKDFKKIFIDFEVFPQDWLLVAKDIDNRNSKKIIVNDRDELIAFYKKHKDDLFVGYNIRGYDQFIFKGILAGFNPEEVSLFIITKGHQGYNFDESMNNIPLNFFEVGDIQRSLKELEGFMGADIVETSVDFTTNRKLTEDEIKLTLKYCEHDVDQGIEVFNRRITEYNNIYSLVDSYDLPFRYMSKTKAQISAAILECQRPKKPRNDEFDIQLVPTLRIKKYQKVVDWFLDKKNYHYDSEFEMDICGVPHKFGWGGIHGCPDKPLYREGTLLHVDVNSYYPSIMIEYNLLSRNSRQPQKYTEIYRKRLQLKKEGKKKEQAPLKVVLNATYGMTKDKNSSAYDPRQANNICINGQLMLVDLLEHLEGHCEIIQSNTDGIIVYVPDPEKELENVKAICKEWEDRTRMGLGVDGIDLIYQKDVNNYCCKFSNGKLERKGSYVKEQNDLDYDLPIVNEAMVKYLMEGVPIEDTINGCKELIKFQKIVKISSKYNHGMHNKEELPFKTFRVFASTDLKDTALYKLKKGGRPEKFANTPDCCFLDCGDVKNSRVPRKLDRSWYIDLAKTRLKQFGINFKDEEKEVQDSGSLF